MKTHRKGWFGSGSRSLARQIVLAENRLDRRKTAAGEIASSLGSRIRSGFASPGGLWIAGCAGFLIAEWVHRPKSRPKTGPGADRKQPSASPRKSLSKQRTQSVLMSKALLLTKLALNLKTAWENANPRGAGPRAK